MASTRWSEKDALDQLFDARVAQAWPEMRESILIVLRSVTPSEAEVDAGAHALMRDDPEAANGTYGIEDYRAMSRAVLVAARTVHDG